MEDDSDSLQDMSLQLEQLLLSDPVLHSKGSSGTTDDYLEQLAPILKDALQQNVTNELLMKCDGFKKDRDKEIDEMCSGDHNEYMSSMRQLSQVTSEAETIKGKVQNFASKLNSTGQGLAEKKNRLLEDRRVRSNVDSAIEAVSACLQVLDLTNNVHELLQEKRKFAALKSLDDLHNVHLKEVSNFGFAQLINQSVPALTKMIRKDTIEDIQKWLDSIQQRNGQIGREAFAAIQRQRSEWKKITQDTPHLRKYKFNSPVEKCFRETGTDHLSNSKVDIDFSHLYECVLVHSSMGMSDEFQHHFDSDRKIQRDYLVPDSLTFKNEAGEDDLERFEQVLQDVAGFCIIDRSISRNSEALRPPKDVEEIWDSLATKISSVLSTHAKTLRYVESLKLLKEIIGTFLHTMQNHGFNVSAIQGILLTLFKTYSDFMKGVFKRDFQTLVDQDDYMPMSVDKPKWDRVLDLCWYEAREENGGRFPRALPFSQTYPFTCGKLIAHINAHNEFLDDLQWDLAQVEDLIRYSVDDLLCETVCKELEDRLRSTNREQVVQTLINIEHFQDAATGVAQLLYDQRLSGRRQKITLKAAETFRNAATLAQAQVFEIIHKAVDNFLGLQDYDWETSHRVSEPSDNLSEMVGFLESLINSTFGNLPLRIKSVLYFETFDYLSRNMLQLLLDSSDRLTYEAVHNFAVDLEFLENYVKNTAESTNDPTLKEVLMELRQCVELIQADDFHNEYNTPANRYKKYNLVKPNTAQELFRRISYAHNRRIGGSNPGSPTASPRASNSPSSTTQAKFMKYYREKKEQLSDRF